MSDRIREIHESIVNGQRRQAVEQIDEYGVADFSCDYLDWLREGDDNDARVLAQFADAVKSYHRIKAR